MIATYFALGRRRGIVFRTQDDPADARHAQRDLIERFGTLIEVRPWQEKFRRDYNDMDDTDVDINGRIVFVS